MSGYSLSLAEENGSRVATVVKPSGWSVRVTLGPTEDGGTRVRHEVRDPGGDVIDRGSKVYTSRVDWALRGAASDVLVALGLKRARGAHILNYRDGLIALEF